jgi:hypothetical protein
LAATTTVKETAETATFNPPGSGVDQCDHGCGHDNGMCSMREAIEAANTNAVVDGCAGRTAGVDTIVLSAGAC